jgi:hypothetical protein
MRTIEPRRPQPYELPTLTSRGSIEATTRYSLVSGQELDMTPEHPAGTVGFGV